MTQYIAELENWAASNFITILTVLTLLAAVISAYYAWKMHRHEMKMVEPWSLTKIKDDYWLLERKHPKLATIYGEEITPDRKSHQITITSTEDGFYKKGSKAVIRITPTEIGSIFNLYYVEHNKQKNNPQRFIGYRDDLSQRNPDLEVVPPWVKPWNCPLY